MAMKLFQVGKVYTARVRGTERKYLCVDRKSSGFIYFRDITSSDERPYYLSPPIRRKPMKECYALAECAEKVEIDKGSTGRIRGYHSGVIILSAQREL